MPTNPHVVTKFLCWQDFILPACLYLTVRRPPWWALRWKLLNFLHLERSTFGDISVITNHALRLPMSLSISQCISFTYTPRDNLILQVHLRSEHQHRSHLHGCGCTWQHWCCAFHYQGAHTSPLCHCILCAYLPSSRWCLMDFSTGCRMPWITLYLQTCTRWDRLLGHTLSLSWVEQLHNGDLDGA